jgi:hypothetical protein
MVLENRSYEQVIGSPQAPYLNGLARRYSLATHYFALSHPSLPNYVGLTGGDTDGILTDCANCETPDENLLDQLDRAHIGWRTYFEGLENRRRMTASTSKYNPHYDPFAYFDRIEDSAWARSRVSDFAGLSRDMAQDRLPRFSWIAPDVYHDGHNASLKKADSYVARLVPRVLDALGPQGVLYLTWDEGLDSDLRGVHGTKGGGHIALIAAGGAARTGATTGTPANHYAQLRTIEANFGVPALRKASLPSTPLLRGLLKPH